MTENKTNQLFLDKQEHLEQRYKISQCRSYVLDQYEGVLRLIGEDQYSIFDVVPAGIYNRHDEQWQWGWECLDLRKNFIRKAKSFQNIPGEKFHTGILKISEKDAEVLVAACVEQQDALGLCRLGWEEPGQILFCVLNKDRAVTDTKQAIRQLMQETGQEETEEMELYEAFSRNRLYRHMGKDFLIDSLLSVPELLQHMKDEELKDLADSLYGMIHWEEEDTSFLMLLRYLQDQNRECFFHRFLEIPVERHEDLRYLCDFGMRLSYPWGRGRYRKVSRYLGRLMLEIPDYTDCMRGYYLYDKLGIRPPYYEGSFWLLHAACVGENKNGWVFLKELIENILSHKEMDEMGYAGRRLNRFLLTVSEDSFCQFFLEYTLGSPLLCKAYLQASYEELYGRFEELEEGKRSVSTICTDFDKFINRWFHDDNQEKLPDYNYYKLEICQNFLERILTVPDKLILTERAVECLAQTVAYVLIVSDPKEESRRPELSMMLRLYEEKCLDFFNHYVEGCWADVDFAASLYTRFNGKYRQVASYLARYLLQKPAHTEYMDKCYLMGLGTSGPCYADACWLFNSDCVSDNPHAREFITHLTVTILEKIKQKDPAYDKVMDMLDQFLMKLYKSAEEEQHLLWQAIIEKEIESVWNTIRCYTVFINQGDWLSDYSGRGNLYRTVCRKFLDDKDRQREYRLGILGYLQEQLGLKRDAPEYEDLLYLLLKQVPEAEDCKI